ATRLTQTGAQFGTPAYMAPEQVEGDVRSMGPRTDVYSLGVIFYQLLTNHLPFEGSSARMYAKILTATPTPPTSLRGDLDPGLEAICLRAMARPIDDRHPSMAALALDLDSILSSPPSK